jgi:hypothetical protein
VQFLDSRIRSLKILVIRSVRRLTL